MHPFDIGGIVRQTTDLYDKRISALTDLFHQTQLSFVEVKQAVEYIKGRVDGGLSPTMQAVKAQNDELEKSILHLENQMIKMIDEIDKRVAVMDEHYAQPITEWMTFQANLRNLVFKVVGAAILPSVISLITMWVWMNQVKQQIESIPTAYGAHHDAKK